VSPRKKASKKKTRQKARRGKRTASKKKLTAKKNLLRSKRPGKKKKRVRGRSETIDTIVFVPYADEEEVTTHEVPEDDVPEEYRDEK
jgi:hypothetical protein